MCRNLGWVPRIGLEPWPGTKKWAGAWAKFQDMGWESEIRPCRALQTL